MDKEYYCKSRVTGKQRKTKHINFYDTKTYSFRFGFRINHYKMFNVLSIRVLNRNLRVSDTLVSHTNYKKTIEEMKNKFGLFRK